MSRVRLPDGGHLAYARHGARREVPLLLVRPLGGSMRLWEPLVEALAGLDVVTFDPRGVGDSSPAPLFVSTRGMAGDALALLDGLGVARADVFGLSLGGLVAAWASVLAPARVRRLALGSTPAKKRRVSPGRGLQLAWQLARREPEVAVVEAVLSPEFRARRPDQVRAILARVRARPTDRMTLLRLGLAAARHHLPPERLRDEILCLFGELDDVVQPARQGWQVELVPGAGHDLSLEAPVALGERLYWYFNQ